MEVEALEPEQVEVLVKKALTISSEEKKGLSSQEKKQIVTFGGLLLIVVMEWFLIFIHRGYPGMPQETFNLLEGMAIGFGIYFWIFAMEKLPDYYDQNRIGSYSHGPVRMNLPGVSFNNRNWPYILKSLRLWTAVTMVSIPLVGWLFTVLPLGTYGIWAERGVLLAYLMWMLLAVYRTGKKYE